MSTEEKKSDEPYRGLANARCERFFRLVEGIRISEDAIATLNRLISQIGIEVAEKANELAIADKRKTVKDRDIFMATTLLDYPLPVKEQTIGVDVEDVEEELTFEEKEVAVITEESPTPKEKE